MSYITASQLSNGPEALQELAQLLSVDVDLLALTIAFGNRSTYTVDEIAAADAALVSIGNYIARADGEIDARLAQRGYTVPMSAASFPILVVWAAAITRYHLSRMRDRTSEETGRVERDYREAIKALQLVADGKLSLGANDPLATSQQDTHSIQIASNPRLMSRTSLAGL